MSNYNQNQAQVAYPPPGTAYPAQAAQGASYTAPPPPAGYPVRDGPAAYPTNDPAPAPGKTKSRGDGFWKAVQPCVAVVCWTPAFDGLPKPSLR